MEPQSEPPDLQGGCEGQSKHVWNYSEERRTAVHFVHSSSFVELNFNNLKCHILGILHTKVVLKWTETRLNLGAFLH
jgi:hypothetical protein